MAIDYLGYAYAATVAAGGMIGYAKAGSIPSLAAGLTFGALLGIGAFYTSQETPRPLFQMTTALALGGMMGMRWARSGKFMPPGLICVLSVLVLGRGLVSYNQYLPMLGSKKA